MSSSPDPSPQAGAGPATRAAPTKPQRILACILCQQRKIKCDRRFPCANCTRVSAQCVPASLHPRERRRRFPERELLARLRYYEGLLRDNCIEFDAQNVPSTEAGSSKRREQQTLETADNPSPSNAPGHEEQKPLDYKMRDVWQTMQERFPDYEPDAEDNGSDTPNEPPLYFGSREKEIKKSYDQWYKSNDHLLFGSFVSSIDLLAMHPQHVHIFRLWQIYLENIDPLLKVTHIPTLQPLIVNAASDLSNVDPEMEALMFSIYCISTQSLTSDECQSFFGSHKEDLLASYQVACQQALSNCGVLRSSNRDCATALYLYLLSIRSGTDPRSLSSMLAVAVRIAQRMGLPNESVNTQSSPFEAEMRRRLWWSLVMLDNRISELADHRTSMLIPTWDCKLPLNVDDRELRPDMKEPPIPSTRPSDAVFVVIRSEIGDYSRHNVWHLDFCNPALKALARPTHQGKTGHVGDEVHALKAHLENTFFKFCNLDNPLQFMVYWWCKCQLQREFMGRYFLKAAGPFNEAPETVRASARFHSMEILKCDTQIRSSPLCKGFIWVLHHHFPFPAYYYLTHVLSHRPMEPEADAAWEVMDTNYQLHFMIGEPKEDLPFEMFSGLIMKAWRAREKYFTELGRQFETPIMIHDILQRLTDMTPGSQDSSLDQFGIPPAMDMDDLLASMPTSFGMPSTQFDLGSQGGPYPVADIKADESMTQLEWSIAGWDPMQSAG